MIIILQISDQERSKGCHVLSHPLMRSRLWIVSHLRVSSDIRLDNICFISSYCSYCSYGILKTTYIRIRTLVMKEKNATYILEPLVLD